MINIGFNPRRTADGLIFEITRQETRMANINIYVGYPFAKNKDVIYMIIKRSFDLGSSL